MFVAASSLCFPQLPFDQVLQRLVDLEYTALELAVHETGGHLKPTAIHADLNQAVNLCRSTLRMTLCSLSVDIEADEQDYFRQFASCCKLAKAIKVVPIVVRSAELGTPFNAEIERLQELVNIASLEGVVVAVRTETGRMTQDPDTTVVMCDNVKGLGVTLDPSHFTFGPHRGGSYQQLIKYVYNVHLRDTSKDELQVRVGQGEVEYGRLVSQLSKVNYNRALCVHMEEIEGVDHSAEMRKMRLLLESLL